MGHARFTSGAKALVQDDSYCSAKALLHPKADSLRSRYVLVPEHVHVLLSEPQHDTLADALKSLKQGVPRRLIGDAEHFWQKRYYDLNIRDYRQFVEKLRYIHRNPVKSGLCERPEEWEWSSFRHYATGTEGRVEIESEWTARKRERAAGRLCPAVELPHSSQNQA
jgi:hypothetical protein